MRTIVVGDVHGCIDELEELLVKVKYETSEDELVFAGDLMDRGPDPVGVVHLVRELQKAQPNKVVCVKGNHEEKHVRWAKHEKKRMETFKKNPMTPFDAKKLREHAQLTHDDLVWMDKLPTMYDITDDWIVVHGGLEASRSLLEQINKVVIRCRYVDPVTGHSASADDPYSAPKDAVHWAEAWPGPQNVIYGHFCERLGEVMIRGKATEHGQFACYGIESGCCFGGALTAMVLDWYTPLLIPDGSVGKSAYEPLELGGWYRPGAATISVSVGSTHVLGTPVVKKDPKISFAQVQAKAVYKAWKSGKD